MAVDRSVLEVSAREGSGKGFARKLRAKGLVPAVVYGSHMEKPLHVSVDPIAVKKAIATPHKFNTLIALKLNGAEHQVLLKEYQLDPLSRETLHVDFISVRDNEPVKVKIPLVLVGKAVGTLEGGILSQVRRELEVYALPKAIPERIEADVSNLKIAQVLHINEVKMPEGVTVKTHVNYTVAVVSVPEREEVAAVVAPVAGAVAAPGAPGAAAPAAAAGGKGAAAPAAAAGKGAAPAAAAKPAGKK